MGFVRTIIRKAGTLIGVRRTINLIEGTNVTLIVADDVANDRVNVTINASGDLLASISGTETITFTALCDILGYGYLNGNADISAQPTAADIAGEFFATFIDGTFTMKDVLKILVAVAAGKTNIVDLGGGNATVDFRDLSDTKNTVVADMTGSERTDITLDL